MFATDAAVFHTNLPENDSEVAPVSCLNRLLCDGRIGQFQLFTELVKKL